MNRTYLVCGAAFLALAGTGLIVQSRTAFAQQSGEGMEEVVVVEAPLEGREIGRSSTTGAKIMEYDLRRNVSYADLDLCSDADVSEMDVRIENTAKDLCKELSAKFPLNPSDNTEIKRCTAKAIESTKVQMQEAVAYAKSDSDGDGVINCMDQCPGTPANSTVDHSGCTVAATPEPQRFELQGVNFEFDSAMLTADSTNILDEAVEMLKTHSDLMVEIAGHTDSVGSDDYNQGLSERRAQAVLDYFVSNGVNAGNLTARGYGESEPVADNGTSVGRAANRRVELRQK